MLGTPIFGDAPPISTVLNARLNRQPKYRAGERPGAECFANAGNRAPAATRIGDCPRPFGRHTVVLLGADYAFAA